MERWKFSRQFKLEVAKLVRDRGVSAARWARLLLLDGLLQPPVFQVYGPHS